MVHNDFRIGLEFYSGAHHWRCTDIGTRVIVAVCLDDYSDSSWYNGPPYAVVETVFDEDDQEGCELAATEAC